MGEVFFALCKSVDTPVALGAWLRYKYAHAELASMEIRPGDYTCAHSFKRDYACVAFLSKWKGLNTGIDLDAVALQSFQRSEDRCRQTNARFRNLATLANPALHSILHAAQRKIAMVLGDLRLSDVVDKCGFGPGATIELPRRHAQVDRKIGELPIAVSRTALPMFSAVLADDLHWSAAILGRVPEGDFCLCPDVFVLTDECKIDTVPKSAKTNRIIAVEPRGNGFLQKGIGGYIRRRLRRVGIDLDDQGRNQLLAKLAWSRNLATLDLRAASDTVSKEVVYHLLPFDWASLMDKLRSRLARLPNGDKVVLEKFSSMGNGFTFELETLIFWAISSAVSERHVRNGVVAVYGDDIIVDSVVSEELVQALDLCGFEVNSSKSFTSGRFYESCGKHYFDGVDVTPAYQKNLIDTPSEAIRCGNRLIRLSFRLGGEKHLDKVVFAAWSALRRNFESSWRFAIPFGVEGDDAWAVPYTLFPFSKGHFSRDSLGRSFASGHGLRCYVGSMQLLEVPADDRALLAVTMRRTKDRLRDQWFEDEAPPSYGGMLEIVPQTPVWVSSRRWVIPNGKFSAVWR